jgi:competence protein ComEC
VNEADSLPAPLSLYPLKFQPLLCLSAMFLAGIALADLLPAWLRLWGAVFLVLLSAMFVLHYQLDRSFKPLRARWQRHLPLNPAWFTLLLAFGMLRFATAAHEWNEHDLAYYNDSGKSALTVVIDQPPSLKNHSTILTARALTYQSLNAGADPLPLTVSGRLRITTLDTSAFRYGDQLRVICYPSTPLKQTGFNFQRYLAARRIFTLCEFASVERLAENAGNPIMAGIYAVRDRAQMLIDRVLPADEAALLSGILLGNEDHIAPQVEMAFQRTGTAHIIAISGANFAVLISFITTLFLRHLPRRWVLPVTLLVIVFYTLFVGGNAAVVRAAIMGSLTVFGAYVGRRNQGLNALAFSAALFTLFNPLILWDLGFQLSFAATLGLVLFSERWTEAVRDFLLKHLSERSAHLATGAIGEYVIMTLAAQVFTLPLIAYAFQQVSLASFLINLLILPAQPLIMALGGLTVLSGLVVPFIGQIIAWFAWVPLAYTLRMVTWGSQWPWASISIPSFSPILLLAYFAAVTALPLLSGWLPKRRLRIKRAYQLTAATLGVISLWTIGMRQPEPTLQIRLFPLENNSSVLLQLPDGKAVLLGRSQAIDALSHALETALAGYQLQVIIQPKPDKYTFDRLPQLLNRFPVEHVFFHPQTGFDLYSQFTAQLTRQVAIHPLEDGQQIQLASDIVLTTLAVRDQSTAFLLTYGDFHVLMPNGASFSEIEQLQPQALENVTVLILNISQLHPEPFKDWLHLPAQAVLINGATIACPACLSTARHGTITLQSDGSQFWLGTSD